MWFIQTGKEIQQDKMRFVLIIMIFFVASALLIISNNNLALYKNENLPKFSSLYVAWLGEVYKNIIATSGYVVRLDWLP